MILQHLNNILSEDFNQNIIYELKNIAKWRISPDEYYEDQGNLKSEYSDSGLLINSFNEELNIPKDDSENLEYSFLNVSAHHIFKTILSKCDYNFTNIKLKRYLWNYYNRASDGVDHLDSNKDNSFSIVYYLHDCDGGTVIGDQFYKSISRNAIIFKSNIKHRGIGPKEYKNRFLLNIVFTADSYERR